MSKYYIKHDYKITGKDYVETDGDTPGGISYSQEEQSTGTHWIDGKEIYQITVDCGAAPNNTLVDIPHNIANVDKVIALWGIGFDTGNVYKPIPMVTAGSATQQIRLTADATNINIGTAYNASSVNIYVTLQYTKTE